MMPNKREKRTITSRACVLLIIVCLVNGHTVVFQTETADVVDVVYVNIVTVPYHGGGRIK
jgi:hypothetical protein